VFVFVGSIAERRIVAQVNFSSCHHILILGIKERKAERKAERNMQIIEHGKYTKGSREYKN
jgi:hypothetical protein